MSFSLVQIDVSETTLVNHITSTRINPESPEEETIYLLQAFIGMRTPNVATMASEPPPGGYCTKDNSSSSNKKNTFSNGGVTKSVILFLAISSIGLFTLSTLPTVSGVEAQFPHHENSISSPSSDEGGSSKRMVVSELKKIQLFYSNEYSNIL